MAVTASAMEASPAKPTTGKTTQRTTETWAAVKRTASALAANAGLWARCAMAQQEVGILMGQSHRKMWSNEQNLGAVDDGSGEEGDDDGAA